MRLIGTIHQIREAESFCHFLTQQGIQNQLDVVTNTDWGSPQYGDRECRIWITDEDQVDEAVKLYEYFHENPEDPRFQVPKKTLAEEVIRPIEDTVKEAPEKIINISKDSMSRTQPMGPITTAIFMVCCLLFFLTQQFSPDLNIPPPKGFPLTPLYSSQLKKDLLFDYPKNYEIVDQIVKLYGIPALQNPDQLPAEGQYLIKQYQNTPYFQGIYDGIINHVRHNQPGWGFDAPLFEKIQQGELWRFFSPCLLHADIFHLLFNMIWVIALGKQMEQRLSKGRYLLFIFLTGIIANVAQYLMGGANFVGYSGIIVAMLTFIWMRRLRAPWEGYLLQGATMAFISLFVIGMFAIQTVSFILEITAISSFSPGIANTAHIIGGILGLILGRLNFFAWKKS